MHAFEEIAADAEPERLVSLATQPDATALARTLLRMRHDFVIIGRAASAPLPDHLAARLGPILERIGASLRDHLLATASAVLGRYPAPSGALADDAVAAYMSEVVSLETERLMRDLSVEERERIFALGFALQQLQQHLSDLLGCLLGWTRHPDRPGHGLSLGNLARATPLSKSL